MAVTHSRKRLILRAVLRQVSPMVIRLVSVPDHMQLARFHDIFRAILGWDGNLGYIIRVHGEEFNSFRRKNRSKTLHELKLHRQKTFLYVCDTLHMWEWDVRLADSGEGEQRFRREREQHSWPKAKSFGAQRRWQFDCAGSVRLRQHASVRSAAEDGYR